MKNVLVFPCGSEIGLEINRALKYSKHFKLFGASSVNDHGMFEYKNYIPNLPNIENVDFIDKLNLVIQKYNIDYIIPAHDSVVLELAKKQNYIDATVVSSKLETCIICRSKFKTYETFKDLINVPIVYNKDDLKKFPVFLKPDVGQGSKGTYLANNLDDVNFYIKKDYSLLILEYLPSYEYTIDCFTDMHGNLLFSEGRIRDRISNGISVNSKIIKDIRFKEMANIINNRLSLRGAWFFQVKARSNGELVLMEIAPRLAGTMGLYRAAGVNFIELSLFDMMGLPIKIISNKFNIEVDRSLQSKFKIKDFSYDYVYIDLDDTIITHDGLVNLDIIKFLYQAKNQNKKIILITKHKYNVDKTLKQYYIDPSIFNEIIKLKHEDNKHDYINNISSIFIDDSFNERQLVFNNKGIPVFSVDSIDTLIS